MRKNYRKTAVRGTSAGPAGPFGAMRSGIQEAAEIGGNSLRARGRWAG